MTALEFNDARVIIVWDRDKDYLKVVNLLEDPEEPMSICEEEGTLGSLLRGLGITLEDCKKALKEDAA